MKTKTLIAAATLSVLFVYYTTQLSQAVESSVGSPTAAIETGLNNTVATTVVNDALSRAKSYELPKSTYNRFVVNNTNKSDITCRKGTRISFPPESFEDNNGNVVVDVELTVEECYDLKEMLAEKLSTTSGTSIIETAGMVNIVARKGGVELRLREGIQYSLDFPIGGKREDDFELFYGERNADGIINWVSAGQKANSQVVNSSTNSARSIKESCFIQICESEFRRRTLVSEMDYFNWQLLGGQTLNQWFVSNFNPDAEMVDDFCADKLFSQITFHVNGDGSFKDYYISHESKPCYDRVIAEFLSTMPPLDLSVAMPSYSADHACILTFGHKQGLRNDDFVERFAKKYDYSDAEKTMSEVNTSDLDYYMFSSTELGWINCDRFYEEQSPLVDFYVEANSSDGASVSMVFEDRKSIVRGYRNGNEFVFHGVPSNTNVRLIGVENASGNPMMDVRRTNTSRVRCKLDHYEPITLARLDGAMCWK
jgi:hypothetical protein